MKTDVQQKEGKKELIKIEAEIQKELEIFDFAMDEMLRRENFKPINDLTKKLYGDYKERVAKK